MGLQKPAAQHRACTHRTLKEGQGVRGGLDKVPKGGTFVDTCCAQGKHKVSIDLAQRATEHVCTPIWKRIQCSLEPESQAKQTLTVFKNECLQAQNISILCIHVHERTTSQVCRSLCSQRGQEAHLHLGSQARGTKCLQQFLLSSTKFVCMLGSARVYSKCQAAATSRKWTHTAQSRRGEG